MQTTLRALVALLLFLPVAGMARDVDPASFAAEMARGLGGSEPVEEDGVYRFTFGNDGMAVVHAAGADLRVISLTGGHAAMEELIDSIEWQ